MHWDGEVYYQSRQVSHYQRILAELKQRGCLYACRCSRKDLAGTPIYPGYCREAGLKADGSTALRLNCQNIEIAFQDALQGLVRQNLMRDQGDFIVRRRDQIIAYQFAVVVDDYQQGITHVVRGADLLDSTPKQIYLQQLLDYPSPHYLHLPLIVDQHDHKLSKQNLAAPVADDNPAATLFSLLRLLRQNPPASLNTASVHEQLDWAIAHWQPQALKKIRAIQPPIH